MLDNARNVIERCAQRHRVGDHAARQIEDQVAAVRVQQALARRLAEQRRQMAELQRRKADAADAVIFGSVGGPKWDSVPYEVRPEASNEP